MKKDPIFYLAIQTFLGAISGKRPSRHLIGSVLGMTLALIPLIVVMVVTDGMITGISARYQETLTYHIQILPFGLTDSQVIRQKAIEIGSFDGIKSVILERQGFGLAYSAAGRTGVTLRGIDNKTFLNDQGFVNFIKYTEGGPGFSSPDGVIIGTEIAKQLKVHVGDELKILTTRSVPGKAFLPRISVFKVDGIVSGGYQEMDKLWVFAPLKKSEEILRGREYQTIIGIKLKSPANDLVKVHEMLQKKLPLDFQNIRTWEQINGAMYKNFQATRTVLLFIMILILCVASVSISSAMLMIVLERQKDIAILKALGTSPQKIKILFIYLGLFSGILGTFLGIGIGLLAAININTIISFIDNSVNFLIGIQTWLTGNSSNEVFKILSPGYYLENIPVTLDGPTVFMIGTFSVLLATLAAWLPARKASKLRPLDILRKV